MTATPRNRRRRRSQRARAVLAVLAILFLGSLESSPASAVDVGQGDEPWAAMTVSVQARISAPAGQAPQDAQVTLDYVLTNTGQVPIYQVKLTDPLVPGRRVECDGDAVIRVLISDEPVECSDEVALPPGTYTSRPDALGWVYVLILGFPVTASAQVTFTVAAPSPPPSPSPSPTPTLPASPAPPSQPSVAASPSPRAPAPSTALTSQSPSPSAKRTTAAPSPGSTTPATRSARRSAFLPPVPTAQTRQLSTHVMVLLLLLPAAVGAAAAGAAAARRR